MSKKVIISPFSRCLRNGKTNPKDYPFWKEVVQILHKSGINVVQIGGNGEESIGADEYKVGLPLSELGELLISSDTWISVDNFFNHFCALYKKPGVVIFGKSDPKIFGYDQNINLLKDRKFLRPLQFDVWDSEIFDSSVFVEPEVVCKAVCNLIQI